MPSLQKLHLEDCLEDTPQTKAMLDLFEKDANMLKKFTKAFSSSCQKISNAQVLMVSATQELSYYLRLYGKQNFPLETQFNDEELTSPKSAENLNESNSVTDKELPQLDKDKEKEINLANTLNQFANYIDEISTCFQVFVTQLNDSMIYPLNKLIDNEFDEINSLNQMYQISSDEEEQVLQKYLRLPTKTEYDLQRNKLAEEVFMFRKKFHQISLNYYSSLNTLQHKRKFMLIEPMLACIHNFKLFFKMGSETFNSSSSSTIDDFLNKTTNKVCQIKENMSEDINKTNQLIDLLQQDNSIYQLEKEGLNDMSINESILHKSGYLNLRSKIPFISKWDRAFYFIQNGFLMSMQKNEIAGSNFMELKADISVLVCNIDDRPFTFQIISQFPKRVVYFQANNTRDRDEWIQILQNAIKEDNRAKLLNYKITHQTIKTDETRKESDLFIQFDLKQHLQNPAVSKKQPLVKPQQGDTFKVRFLGSMNVKADKGNEYINDTIRQVMGARAQQNIFKLSEFNLVINSESLNLFSIPTDETEQITDDLFKAKFDMSELAFWCPHKDNERLFGFIIKESNHSLKFVCHVFESDVNSKIICESITQATHLAYQLLIKENRSEHFMKMKNTEREILLQNIKNLPDKKEDENSSDEENKLLQNAASAAFNSPNPNFVVLDKEMLENYKSSTQETLEDTTKDLVDKVNSEESKEKIGESEA